MTTYHSVQLKKRTFEKLPECKKEFLRFHPDWEMEMISNDKIIYEAIKFYLAVESGVPKKGSS